MSSVAKAVGSFFGFGGRSGGGGSPSGPSAEDAAAQARREAEAQAEKVRKENAAQMAIMQQRLDSVKKASAYNANMRGANHGDIGKGLSRKASNLKKARAMRTRDTRIRLDPQAGTGQQAGAVNV